MLLKYLKVIFVCPAGSNLLWTQGQSWPPKHLRIVWPLERLSRSHIWNNTGPMLCREPMRALDFHDVLADTDDATWFDLHVISHLSSACDLWLEKGVSLRQFRSLKRHDKKLPYYDPWLIYQTCGCRHRQNTQNILDNYVIMCISCISDVCQCDVKKSLHPGEAAFGSERVRSFRRSWSEERCWKSTKAHHNPRFNHMLKPLRVRNSNENFFEVSNFWTIGVVHFILKCACRGKQWYSVILEKLQWAKCLSLLCCGKPKQEWRVNRSLNILGCEF